MPGFDKGDGVNDARQNVMIYRNEPVKMGDYTVTYLGDSVSAPKHFFKVDYKRYSGDKLAEEFILEPNVLTNPQAGAEPSPVPDTKHYFLHDLYTHITALPVNKEKPAGEGGEAAAHGEENDDKSYDPPVTNDVKVGDTIRFQGRLHCIGSR